MKIQVNTDSNIEGDETLAAFVTSTVEEKLDRFKELITRVEVHLSDQNSHKEMPDDKRCVLEARLAGRQPIAVTHEGDTLHQAVIGATDKMRRALDTALGKLRAR